MKRPLRTRLSRRQALCCIVTLVLLLAPTLVFWTPPPPWNNGSSSSSSAAAARGTSATPLTLMGPSAFPNHLYHHRHYTPSLCYPTGIHSAQADNAGEGGHVSMTISFHLDYESCRDAIPTVLYGRKGSFWDKQSVIGDKNMVFQFNYTSDKSHGLFQSPWIWHMPLQNLKVGPQQYWYKIVVTQGRQRRTVASTQVYYFYTPPEQNAPTSLALVGDLGQTENSTKTMQHIWRAASRQSGYNQHFVTQLIIAGDLSYADSDPFRWTSWFDIMEPLLRVLPLSVAVGNHEIECDTVTHEPFQHYEQYFRMPNRVDEANILPVDDDYRKTLWNQSCSAPSQFQGHYDYGNSFYSYEHGLATIIVLNSYTNSTVGSVQYEWLAELLDDYDRAVTPWLIVVFHSPLYTTFLGHVNEIEARLMRQAMEPLFLDYGVNFVVSGHDHAYMRTKPLYQEAVDPTGQAPIYLTLGAAGNREQHSSGYRNDNPEAWVAKRDIGDYGYGNLFLPNATHARFHWVRDGVEDMGVIDHVWLVNPHVERVTSALSR